MLQLERVDQNFEIYIAGPLFNSEENEHNRKLAAMFREAGYGVFNPIDDGIEGASLSGLSDEEIMRQIHSLDYQRVLGSTIFVANLNGPQVDDGTAAESGMAYVSKSSRLRAVRYGSVELMLGYLTDTRWLTPNMRRNPLVLGSFDKVFDSREEIIEYALQHSPPLAK